MKAKPYNPLEKVLAERKAKAGGADFDASVADATAIVAADGVGAGALVAGRAARAPANKIST